MSPRPLNEDYPGTFVAERRPVIMQVEIACQDGAIDTLEGKVAYRAGDAIVTGVQGERWPIQRPRFEATYSPCAGTQSGDSGLYLRKPFSVLACRLAGPLAIRLAGDRGELHGKAGDWLVEFAPGDRAIVADLIFQKTYRISCG